MSRYENNLRKSVKAIQAEKDIDRSKRKADKADNRERIAYNKLPAYNQRMEFWCDHCQIDFVAPAYKTWSTVHFVGAWHSFCPLCEGWVYRHITSRAVDPYYNKSMKIQHMRGKGAKDMLQPHQYGYQTMYGDAFEESYMQHQQQHEVLFNKYASMGLSGKTLAQKSEEIDL